MWPAKADLGVGYGTIFVYEKHQTFPSRVLWSRNVTHGKVKIGRIVAG